MDIESGQSRDSLIRRLSLDQHVPSELTTTVHSHENKRKEKENQRKKAGSSRRRRENTHTSWATLDAMMASERFLNSPATPYVITLCLHSGTALRASEIRMLMMGHHIIWETKYSLLGSRVWCLMYQRLRLYARRRLTPDFKFWDAGL